MIIIVSLFILTVTSAIFLGMDYLFDQSLFKELEELEKIFG